MFLSQFQLVGHDLCARGMVASSSGNLSIRIGDDIFITRHGCRLGCLQEHDLIETGVVKNSRATPLASSELPVHRAIYQATAATAIVHAHPPHAVALSLAERFITPSDSEGLALLAQVPVIGWDMEIKAGGFADLIAAALKDLRIVMVHGHGSFAIGQLLEEAHNLTTAFEESCRVICLLKSLKVNPAPHL
jgi:L-fuculose-phosphate aldolase